VSKSESNSVQKKLRENTQRYYVSIAKKLKEKKREVTNDRRKQVLIKYKIKVTSAFPMYIDSNITRIKIHNFY